MSEQNKYNVAKKLDWHPEVHHPAAEIISHTCSPLSAALFIWAIHKSWQRPFMRTFVQARWATIKSAFRPNRAVSAAVHVEQKFDAPASSVASSASSVASSASTPITKASMMAAMLGSVKVPAADAATQAAVADTTAQTSNVLSSAEIESLVPNLASAIPNLGEKLQALYRPEDIASLTEHLHDLFSCAWMTDAMVQFHSLSGLPWWAVIASATVLFRIAVMPIFIYQQRNSLRMAKAAPELKSLQAQFNEEKDPQQKADIAKRFLTVLRDHDCTPLHQWYVPILFPSVFLSYFGSVHNLCLVEPSMAVEGLWWFQNLMVPDPTYLLPIFSALSWLAVMELGGGRYYTAWNGVRTLSRLATACLIPVTMVLPAGIFMFWIPANIYAATRALVMRTNTARAIFGVPIEKEVASLLHLPKRVPPFVWPEDSILPRPKNSMSASDLYSWLKYNHDKKHPGASAKPVQSEVRPAAPQNVTHIPHQQFRSESDAAVASTSVKVD